MFRHLALVAVLAVAAVAAPIQNFDSIHEQFKSLMPEELATLMSITTDEKIAFIELSHENARSTNFKSREELLAELKDKIPSLHEKYVKFHEFFQAKVDKLGLEAKFFVGKVITEVCSIQRAIFSGRKADIEQVKAKLQGFIAEYTAVSEESKAELSTQFSFIAKVAEIPEIMALVEKYIN